MCRPWSVGRPPKEALLSILAISHRFMMDSGVDWAIQALDCLDSDAALSPTHRLQLAFRYKIQQWILPAVSSLIDRQVSRKQLRLFTNDDIDQMGIRTYIVISKGIEAVQSARTSVAITTPIVHHSPQCRLHQKDQDCTQAWVSFWLTTIPRTLLAADNPMPLQSLSSFLQQTSVKNVHDTCKTLTVFHFRSTEVVKVETMVKEQVSSKVWGYYEEGLM